MINEKIMYEKVIIFSKRFGEKIEVEVYQKDAKTVVISSNSLYAIFQQLNTNDGT